MSINGTVIGFLGREPEWVTLGSYKAVKFSIGSTSGYGDRKFTTWIDCMGFGKIGEGMGRLKKGEQVGMSGEIYEDKYLDATGQERRKLRMDVKTVTYLTGNSGGLVKDDIGMPDKKAFADRELNSYAQPADLDETDIPF